MSPNETLEQQAARKAMTLTYDGGWKRIDAFAGGPIWIGQSDEDEEQLTAEQAEALKAHRDKVTTEIRQQRRPDCGRDVRRVALTDLLRKMDLGIRHLGVGPHHRELARDGLTICDERCEHTGATYVELTDFGRDVARMLTANLEDSGHE